MTGRRIGRAGTPASTAAAGRSGSRGLAALLATVLTPAARERGFAEAALFADWPRIVGASLAERCAPLRVEFARGRSRHGTLVLRAGGAAALELQHAAPQIIERINGYFGYPAVARLRFVHMPPQRRVPCPAPRPPAPLSVEELAALDASLRDFGPARLAAALRDLGETVLQSSRRPEREP